MEELCRQHHLLTEERGVVRAPFLVKGRLVLPPEMGREAVESAFSEADHDTRYLKLPQAQLIREPILEREAMKYRPEYLYQVMPPLNPLDLVESDIDRLVRGPYALAVDEVVAFAQAIGDGLEQNWATVERVRQLCGRTMDHPLSRLVVVRPVEDLTEALTYLHAGVSTAGVYPESRRMALRDRIAARGVSNVLPLGQCERIVPGAPHDGMIVLSELVDWKSA
jgi:hypothetical protein